MLNAIYGISKFSYLTLDVGVVVDPQRMIMSKQTWFTKFTASIVLGFATS